MAAHKVRRRTYLIFILKLSEIFLIYRPILSTYNTKLFDFQLTLKSLLSLFRDADRKFPIARQRGRGPN